MKTKALITPALIIGIFLILVCAPQLTAQEPEQPPQQTKIIIPEQVKTVLEEGAQSRQARLDIPFTIVKNLYLPAQQNLHSVIFFTVKNADLGFAAPAPVPAAEGEQEAAPQTTTEILQSRSHVFIQFSNADGTFNKEVYIPLFQQINASDYDAEKEEVYTTAYPLPAGQYLISMAIASDDLTKIGTQYFEFTLPDPMSFTAELETTPIFFVKEMDRMSAPETTTEIHKGFFTYSVLQVTPNLDHVFTAGENLDIFFFIYGAQANEQGRNELEINYEIVKDEETIIRYAPASYDMALVSQPLPLKRTVLVKSTKEGTTTEKREERDLEPGAYVLNIEIADKIAGKTIKKSINIEYK